MTSVVAALKAVKLTPSLLFRFLISPLRKVENPCLYCPGICVASCPTYLETGNLVFSPLGYARYPGFGINDCLKCWRCVSECPVNYHLPESFSGEIDVEAEVLREGNPYLVSIQRLDEELASKLADALGTGIILLKGLLERYERGARPSSRSLRKVRKILSGKDLLAISPEASHFLGIPFIAEKLADLSISLEYEGPVHIPCLLLDRKEYILEGLVRAGVKVSSVIEEGCIRQEPPEALLLCPWAKKKGKSSFFDLMSFNDAHR